MKENIKVELTYFGKKLILEYKSNGVLEYVTDTDTNQKMILQYTQVGLGYEMTNNNGYVSMDMCNAVYVRIIELDLFIPKFLFIPNN